MACNICWFLPFKQPWFWISMILFCLALLLPIFNGVSQQKEWLATQRELQLQKGNRPSLNVFAKGLIDHFSLPVDRFDIGGAFPVTIINEYSTRTNGFVSVVEMIFANKEAELLVNLPLWGFNIPLTIRSLYLDASVQLSFEHGFVKRHPQDAKDFSAYALAFKFEPLDELFFETARLWYYIPIHWVQYIPWARSTMMEWIHQNVIKPETRRIVSVSSTFQFLGYYEIDASREWDLQSLIYNKYPPATSKKSIDYVQGWVSKYSSLLLQQIKSLGGSGRTDSNQGK